MSDNVCVWKSLGKKEGKRTDVGNMPVSLDRELGILRANSLAAAYVFDQGALMDRSPRPCPIHPHGRRRPANHLCFEKK